MIVRGEQVDYLIVGQGLAGSVLARALLQRGKKVLVIDREDPSGASRVAGGLVNPITGKKLTKTWRADTLLPFAKDFYRRWETELGEQVYFEKKIWRFFQSDREEEIWKKKRQDPEIAPYVTSLPLNWSENGELQAQAGGFQVRHGARVATKRLLALFREQLRSRGILRDEVLTPSELRITPDSVHWGHVAAKKVLFCEGHTASENPYFSWIPFRHAKGQLLTVRGPEWAEDVVLNRGKWLLPTEAGFFRAGATYEWDDLTSGPTAAGRDAILEGLRSLVRWEPEVVGHQAGVRPIVQDTRPVAGLHPADPAVGIFNGLGSKGVLWAPYFAEQLADHLDSGAPLDPEVDVRRNL